MTTNRNLIHVTDRNEEVDIGPATPEQIAASDADPSGTGAIQVDEDGDVIPAGGFHRGELRTVYVA